MDARSIAQRLVDNIERVIIGKRSQVELAVMTLMCVVVAVVYYLGWAIIPVAVLIVVLTIASVFCTVRCFVWLFSLIRQHAVSPTIAPNKEVGEDD